MTLGRDCQRYEDDEIEWVNRELREMSMDRCYQCFDPVDTDEDLDCYIALDTAGEEVECMCEKCRDKFEAQIQEQYGRAK